MRHTEIDKSISSTGSGDVDPNASVGSQDSQPTPPSSTASGLILFLVILISSVALISYLLGQDAQTLSRPWFPRNTAVPIAVEPFQVLGGLENDGLLSLELTDKIQNILASRNELQIIRSIATVVGDYCNKAKQAHVDTLLRGTMQRVGDQFHVTVQLMNTSECLPMWTEKFHGESSNLHLLAGDISTAISNHMLTSLNGDDGASNQSDLLETPVSD